METPAASFILIRHMKVDASSSPGGDNPSICEAGKREAAKLGETLRSRAVYSSDLRRAHETAAIISQSLGVPLELRPQLRELLPVTPEALRASEQIVTDAIDDIAGRHADSSIVVVAHSGTIRAIARHLLQLPLGTYFVPSLANGGLLVFRRDAAGGWTSTS